MPVFIRFLRGTPWVAATAVAATIAATATATVLAADVYTRADSTSMRQKIERIVQAEHTVAQRKTPSGLTTPLTQREVNSYLRYDLAHQVPVGIAEPVITILGEGRLLGEAIVDLDAVSRANPPKSLFDPMRLLTGRLPVRVQGVLVTSRGQGRFSLETATIAGVPIPKTVLQTLVTHYSRSQDNPNGVGLDDPFALPAAIREIRVEPGRAIIVQ
jgi:hypothetical protein